jgi:hypothetical protein
MRIVFNLFLIICSFSAYAQDQVIDARLVKNRGKQAEDAFKYNMNSYNYMLFELDSAYVLVSRSSLTETERSLISTVVDFSKVRSKIGTPEFNYMELGIRPSKQSRQYFYVDAENVLVVFKISEITKAFTASPFNTK